MRSPKINPLSHFLQAEFGNIRKFLSTDNYFINMQIEQARMLFVIVQVAKNSLVEKASSYGMNVRVLLSHHRHATNLESGLLSQVRGAGNVITETSGRSVVSVPKHCYGNFGSRPVSSIERMLSVVSSRSSELLKQSEQLTTFEKLCASASNIVRKPIFIGAVAIAKSPLPKSDYPFKGGDNLEGIHAHYHHIMMVNELEGGAKAYEFKWAGTRKSGPSFGGNQMDISSNSHARKVLCDIVKYATYGDDSHFLCYKEALDIEKILSNPKELRGRKAEEIFGAEVTDKINKALKSEYGKREIHKAYLHEISVRAQKIEDVVAILKNGPGKDFAQTTEGKLYLFDYDNQYDITKDGPLCRYLNGEEVTLKSGQKIPRFSKNKFTKINFFEFLTQLEYYKNNSLDVERRYKNIADHVDRYVDEGLQKGDDKRYVTKSECEELYSLYNAFVHRGDMRFISFEKDLRQKYNFSKSFEEVCGEFHKVNPTGPEEPEQSKSSGWGWW
jgi:hypothetical protein